MSTPRMDIAFTQRTDTYLDETRYDRPKQVFQLLRALLAASGLETHGAHVLDVGCATGEMIYYLQRQFPGMRFTGLDNQPQLLEEARRHPALQDVAFQEADALDYRDTPRDVVTCFGMLGIFDHFEPLLESLLANTREGGRVYVHALFNDADIDVRIYYRDHHNGKDWNRGFNIFSMRQVERWLASRVQSCRFHTVTFDEDFARRPDAPHRAYTTQLADGRRVTTNGLCLMLPEKVLEIVV